MADSVCSDVMCGRIYWGVTKPRNGTERHGIENFRCVRDYSTELVEIVRFTTCM